MILDTVKLREHMSQMGVGVSALTRASGLSRATVSSLLNREHPRVRERTGGQLCRALRLPQGSLNKNGAQSAYMGAVAEQNATLDFAGLGLIDVGSSLTMDRGFIPVKVSEPRDAPDACDDQATGPRDLLTTRGNEPGMSVGEAMLAHRCMFLLGDPGSGKTTALRHMARAYALKQPDQAGYPDELLVPLLVRLADWAEQIRSFSEVDIVDAALSQAGLTEAPEMAHWLRKQVEDNGRVVLLDGLDEVVEPPLREAILEGIRSYVASYPDARVIITARIVGFDVPQWAKRFAVFQLDPVDGAALRSFLRRWHAFRHGHPNDKRCAECSKDVKRLFASIVRFPRIRALVGNPMMLTILALLHEAGATLPQRRWELYQKIVEAFLFAWEQKKHQAMASAPDRGLKLDDRELRWLLQGLALEMQKHDWTLVGRHWLSEHTHGFLCGELGFDPGEAKTETDALIWSLQCRAGVLAERGPERYGFAHLAFQEYFAAAAILALDDPIEALRPYFYHPRWREVARLVAAQLDLRRVSRLLRAILDDPDPTGRFLHRGLLMVLACLTDGAAVHDQELVDQIGRAVTGLARSNWLGLASDALLLLSKLRETRLKELAEGTVDAVLEAGKEALSKKDFSFLAFCACMSGFVSPSGEHTGDTPSAILPDVVEKRFVVRGEEIAIRFMPLSKAGDAEWREAMIEQLTADPSPSTRSECAGRLHPLAHRDDVAQALLTALSKESDPEVRTDIAHSLGPGSKLQPVADALVTRFGTDPDEDVRAACAFALREAAPENGLARDRLLSLLRSAASVAVRGGAARGLERCATRDAEIRQTLLGLFADENEAEDLRVAALHSLKEGIGPTSDGFASLLHAFNAGPSGKLRRVAAQVLAECASTGRARWEDMPIDKIEHTLVSVDRPCQHVLDALRALVDAREIRRLGIPREARIERALSDFRDQIKLMFIFGSSARGQQTDQSDVDLMVIGEVSLRQLTSGLKQAEEELGKPVNAVIYSAEEWRKRCQEGNVFAQEVLSGEKVFIIGDNDELTAMAG